MLKKLSSQLAVCFYIIIINYPIHAMELSGSHEKYSKEEPSKKRKRTDSPDDGKPKKRGRTNYTTAFEHFQINGISNETLLEKVVENPHSCVPDSPDKKYRDALFFRIYKGIFPLYDVNYHVLANIVSQIRISKKMSDLDIFAWCLVRPIHYLQKIKGPLKTNVNKARKEIDEILAKKSAGDFNFYSLCWGIQRLNPSLGLEGINQVTLAHHANNGFASYLISQLKQEVPDINFFYERPLKPEAQKKLKEAFSNGYLHAAFVLGVHELQNYHFKTAFKYFKAAAEEHPDCQKFVADPMLAKLIAIRKGVKQENTTAQKEMALIYSGNAHKVIGPTNPLLTFLPINQDLAIDLFQKAISDDDADAQFEFAEFLSLNIDLHQKFPNLSIKLFNQAANSGHISACKLLAPIAYSNFEFDRALELYKIFKKNKDKPTLDAPQLPIPSGAGLAARFAATPEGALSIFSNTMFIEEMNLYERTLKDDPIALKELGEKLLYRLAPYLKAKSFLERALNLGCKEALLPLADISYRFEQYADIGEIKEKYLSIVNFMPHAHSRLGSIALFEGNVEAAVEHFRTACQSNDPLGLARCDDPGFKLLEIYLSQEPLKKYFLAKIFYNEQHRKDVLNKNGESQLIWSFRDNLPRAVLLLEELRGELQRTDIENMTLVCELLRNIFTSSALKDINRARELLFQLDELGNAEATMSLALAYRGHNNDYGIAQDDAQFLKYLQKAADRNHHKALLPLLAIYCGGGVRYQIIADKFQALKYAILWKKHPQTVLLDPDRERLVSKCFTDVFLRTQKPTDKDATWTKEQESILDSLKILAVGHDKGHPDATLTSELENFINAHLCFCALFNQSGLKDVFTTCSYASKSYSEISTCAKDLIDFIMLLHKNINNPGFLVTSIIPKDKATLEMLFSNPDYLPVEKTANLYESDEIQKIITNIKKLPRLLKELQHKNTYALCLLEKYKELDNATIELFLEALSLDISDSSHHDYIKSIFGHIMTQDNKNWSKEERLVWAKEMLNNIQEYCSDDVISLIEDTTKEIFEAYRNSEQYRNKIFQEANPFLFGQW